MKTLDLIEFDDQETAQSCLNVIQNLAEGSLVPPLLEALGESADPLKAVVGLSRFLERSLSAETEASAMISSPRYLHMLVVLFAQGNLLSDTLCRNPEYGAWLWTEATLDRALTRDELLETIRHAFSTLNTFEERCVWMRRRARVELLRIATREVFLLSLMPCLRRPLLLLGTTSRHEWGFP